nr:hypothetical protein [Tanacetum cinerariifolium]
IRRALVMLEILSRRFLLKINLSDHSIALPLGFYALLRHVTFAFAVVTHNDPLLAWCSSWIPRSNNGSQDRHHMINRVNRIISFLKNQDHKSSLSDGTLNDIHNALDDRLKGIRMQYLPTSIWRRGDKDRAAAMIQAIEKMLKTRRILRSLENCWTVVPPKTKAQKLARKNELKAKSTLLLAIPEEHLLKFHSIKDAKSLWEAIKISNVCKIDEDNNQEKDRYTVGIGYHAVPPPYTGNYMPPRADLSFARLDDSVFKFKISETRTSVNENESIASKFGEEIRE